MGLEQGGISPLSEVLKDSSLHPAGRGYPGLTTTTTKSTRRSLLVSVLAGLAAVGYVEVSDVQAGEEIKGADLRILLFNDEITKLHQKVIKELGDEFNITGAQLTKPFEDPSGISEVFDSGVFVLSPEGELTVKPIITQIDQMGKNTLYTPVWFGGPIPQRGYFDTSPSDEVMKIVGILGKALKTDFFVTGAADFSDHYTFRIGNENGGETGILTSRM